MRPQATDVLEPRKIFYFGPLPRDARLDLFEIHPRHGDFVISDCETRETHVKGSLSGVPDQ